MGAPPVLPGPGPFQSRRDTTGRGCHLRLGPRPRPDLLPYSPKHPLITPLANFALRLRLRFASPRCRCPTGAFFCNALVGCTAVFVDCLLTPSSPPPPWPILVASPQPTAGTRMPCTIAGSPKWRSTRAHTPHGRFATPPATSIVEAVHDNDVDAAVSNNDGDDDDGCGDDYGDRD